MKPLVKISSFSNSSIPGLFQIDYVLLTALYIYLSSEGVRGTTCAVKTKVSLVDQGMKCYCKVLANGTEENSNIVALDVRGK